MSRPINRSVINFNQFKRESTNAAFERGVDLFVEGVEEEDLPAHTVGLNKTDAKAVRAGFIVAEVASIATKPVTEPIYKNGDEQEQEWLDRSEGR